MKKNHWFPLDGHPDIYVGQYVVPNFISNSIAILPNHEELWLISPGETLIASVPDRWQISTRKISIIFPNAYHHLGVQSWLDVFPEAKLYASKKAEQRLKKLGFTTIIPLDHTPFGVDSDYQVMIPPGHRGGDVWLQKRSESDRVWITCDSFLNYERLSNQWLARALQKLLGAAPDLKISQVIKWLLMDNRKAFKPWVLSLLDQERPTILIPSHGEIARDDRLYLLLKDVVHARL